MDNLPNVILTDAGSSRENKTYGNISQNKVVGSDDFIVRKTAHGTQMQLKSKHKHHMHYLNYVGEWDASKRYDVNDVVRVLPGWTYMDSDGNEVSSSVGVWVCVSTVLDDNYSNAIIDAGMASDYPEYVRWEDVNYNPIWPEPEEVASDDNPDGCYWELIGMLPTEITTCENNEEVTYYVGAIKKDTHDP